uniref:Uncharacterized protein n=1 Tax=Globisporangium ultimum (strain ATCC 200006 / CBS 805.95 / DAOM BR144) TaxID=431595 RepID=K3WR75_GLOUD
MVDIQRTGAPHVQAPNRGNNTSSSAGGMTASAVSADAASAMPMGKASARITTPSPSTSSASTSSIHADDGYTSSQYRSSFKEEDLTEGEESLYSGPSISSPYFYGNQMGTPVQQQQHLQSQQQREEEELFASYTSTPQQELDDQMRGPSTWDYYYPPVSNPTSAPSGSASSSSVMSAAGAATGSQMSRHPQQQLPSRFPQDRQQLSQNPPQPNQRSANPQTANSMQQPRFSSAATSSAFPAATSRGSMTTSNNNSSNVIRQGAKRPLDHAHSSSMASPTVSIASSMIAMRNIPDALDLAQNNNKAPLSHPKPTAAFVNSSSNTINISAAASSGSTSTSTSHARKLKKELDDDDADNLGLELQFLRTHVVELQSALREQVSQLGATPGQQHRAARLSQFLESSIHKVEEMSSGGRLPTPAQQAAGKNFGSDMEAINSKAGDDRSGDDTDGLSGGSDVMSKIEVDDPRSIHTIDPMTGYHLSDERKKTLLNIASFVRVNMSLESRSFSPEVISCLPIEMDGWQLRLSITEKNYTIHNCKFFPCNLMDMYDFCWETNVSQKISIKQGKKHYTVVTPIDNDVAHVYSKTIGKWSLSVHGVPNVSYNSLVCRRYETDQQRAIICQQSVLEERDFEDESTLPWLFKRWVVFQPHVVDGVQGTLVEAFRTASYATGKLIYKENNTYDSFCEHLIRRYAESNSLLERMMARDKRFQHVAAVDMSNVNEVDMDYEETASDRMREVFLRELVFAFKLRREVRFFVFIEKRVLDQFFVFIFVRIWEFIVDDFFVDKLAAVVMVTLLSLACLQCCGGFFQLFLLLLRGRTSRLLHSLHVLLLTLGTRCLQKHVVSREWATALHL